MKATSCSYSTLYIQRALIRRSRSTLLSEVRLCHAAGHTAEHRKESLISRLDFDVMMQDVTRRCLFRNLTYAFQCGEKQTNKKIRFVLPLWSVLKQIHSRKPSFITQSFQSSELHFSIKKNVIWCSKVLTSKLFQTCFSAHYLWRKIKTFQVPRYGFRVSDCIHLGLEILACLYLCFIRNASERFRQAIKAFSKKQCRLAPVEHKTQP